MDHFWRLFGSSFGILQLVGVSAAWVGLVSVAWRVRQGTRPRFALWDAVVDAGMVASVAVVATITLAPSRGDSPGPINLVPFATLVANAQIGWYWAVRALAETVANVLLFVPIGLFAGLRRTPVPPRRLALAALGFSLSIEIAQGLALSRYGDVTDVIANWCGAMLGYGLAAGMLRLVARRQAAPRR